MRFLTGLAVAALLCVPASAAPLTYMADLNGATENPANASAGTGTSKVVYDPATHWLNIWVTFSGLSGTTTASHIHCCTADAMSGNAGVATELPTFSLFPLGVTSGSFHEAYDLTNAASFNTAFITASGGTVADAEMALAAGLADGHAYLNIHTTAFRAGEIRGFLGVPEPATLLLAGFGLLAAFGLRRRRAAV